MGDALAPAPRSSFPRYWTAAAISSFGSAVTAVAMPVLVVQLLGATPFEVGVVNAAQFVPYALLGLIAGVYTDRWRRKPVLVWASVGRALSLSAVPILWHIGVLQIWMLVIALLLFGAFSVFGFAARPSRWFLAWYPERDWSRPMRAANKQGRFRGAHWPGPVALGVPGEEAATGSRRTRTRKMRRTTRAQ